MTKPIYGTNEELNCGTITYGDKIYYIDFADIDKICNYNKKNTFNGDNKNHSFYDYLDFICGNNFKNISYVFENNNRYDLRRNNIKIYHIYHKNILENYEVIEYIEGHSVIYGQYTNMMKNPMWRIKENDKEYLLMYCEENAVCKLCDKSYQKILDYEKTENKKLTFYRGDAGYIFSSNTSLYMHQIITDCYGNGKGTKTISVDHIDQDKLNNTYENLRIATREEQEQNSNGIKDGTKRQRKSSAKELPDGITQDMMKKYVVYYREIYGKDKEGNDKEREYFKVEKHPNLQVPFITSKSIKISIIDKLNEANKVAISGVKPEQDADKITLPKYVSLTTARDKPHLVFERRVKEEEEKTKRLNIKMVLPTDFNIENLQEQIEIFNEKIKEKYGEENKLF